jgi:hypothetical protein
MAVEIRIVEAGLEVHPLNVTASVTYCFKHGAVKDHFSHLSM